MAENSEDVSPLLETSPTIELTKPMMAINVNNNAGKVSGNKLLMITSRAHYDVDFSDQLGDKFVSNWEEAFDRFEYVDSSVERLAVIVSHPHGCRKHILVGQWSKCYNVNKCLTGYKYTTPTCPGSLGAFVLIPSFDDGEDIQLCPLMYWN
ncbi:hypothetical protein Btru_037702 [Bulinus truncatus]|nr:hypothetical protein Btru_037702 [Bulinus truncatus]